MANPFNDDQEGDFNPFLTDSHDLVQEDIGNPFLSGPYAAAAKEPPNAYNKINKRQEQKDTKLKSQAAVAKKAEVETGQHQVSVQEKIKGADTVDAGIVNHRTKELERGRRSTTPINTPMNSKPNEEIIFNKLSAAESDTKRSWKGIISDHAVPRQQPCATPENTSGVGLNDKTSANKRITADEVVSMIGKLVESGSKIKNNKVESQTSSSPLTGASSKKQTDKSGVHTPTKGDTRVSQRFHPLFFIPDEESGHKSSTFSSVTQSGKTRWSVAASTTAVVWSKWTWLIAPLRKWDTLTQTGRMHAIRPLEPVQIRYPKDKGVCDEAVLDSLLSQHELPVTITTQLMHMAAQFPSRQILFEREANGRWRGMTYSELKRAAEQLACSLIQSRISPGSAVIIAGATHKNMILSLLGGIFTAHPVLLLDSLSDLHPNVMKFLYKHADVEAIFCGRNDDTLRIAKYIAEFPRVRVIVNMSAAATSKQIASTTMVYAFSNWQELGKNVPQAAFTFYLNNNLAPNKVAVIKPQYFSIAGHMTGKFVSTKIKDDYYPKCIMVTHDNIVSGSRHLAAAIGLKNGKERWVSHLAWSQTVLLDILPALLIGASIYIPPENAVQSGQLFTYCREIKPTSFQTTPTVWRKLVESLLKEDSAIEGKGGGVSYSVRKWAIKQGKTTGLCLQTGTYKTGTSLAKKLKFHAAEALVFNRIRKQLGLHKAYNSQASKLNATNNNPRLFRMCQGHEDLDETTKDYLRSINLPFLTWYWFDEIGTVAIQRDRHSQGTQYNQALLVEGVSCYIEKRKMTEDDELCFSGRGVFAGYLGDERATSTKLSPNGLLCKSGAHGASFKQLVLISKRLDNYIITSSGKCVEAEPIEKKLISLMPVGVIQDCVLLGEGMSQLLLLISFKTTNDSVNLHGAVTTWCKKLGSTATTVADLTEYKDKFVRNEILGMIAKINEMLHNREETITSFVILPRVLEEGIEIDESTHLYKRHIISRVFQRYINDAYRKQWKVLSD